MVNRRRIAIVVLALMLGTFANNGLSTMYVLYEGRFALNSLTITTIFATYAIAVLLALLLFGHLSDEVGRRPLMITGTLLVLASTLVLLFASGTYSLYLGRAIMGLATGTTTAAGSAALVDLDPHHDRARASLLTTLAFLSGAAFAPLIFGTIEQYLPSPLHTPYLFELLLDLVGLAGLIATTEPSSLEVQRLRFRLRRPYVPPAIRLRFAIAGLVVTIGWMVGGLYGSLSGSLDVELLHLHNHALVGLILFLFAAIGGASQLLFRQRSARLSMTIGVLATVAGIAAVDGALSLSSAPLFLVATVVSGVGNGLCFIGSLALVNEIAIPARRAELVASYNVVAYFALSLPVVGIGLLADHIGLKSATLLFSGVLFLLSAIAVIGLTRIIGLRRPSLLVAESTIA